MLPRWESLNNLQWINNNAINHGYADFLVRGVVRASRTSLSDTLDDTSNDASDFLVRGSDGRLLANKQKPRPKKIMHISFDFVG